MRIQISDIGLNGLFHRIKLGVRDIGLLWYTSVVDGRLVVSQQA